MAAANSQIPNAQVAVVYQSQAKSCTFSSLERMSDLKTRLLNLLRIDPQEHANYAIRWYYCGEIVKVPYTDMLVSAAEAHDGRPPGSHSFTAKVVRMEEVIEEFPDDEEAEISPEIPMQWFTYRGAEVCLTEKDLRNKKQWLGTTDSFYDEFDYGADPLMINGFPMKFVQMWPLEEQGEVQFEPLKFTDVSWVPPQFCTADRGRRNSAEKSLPLRDIRSHNAIIAIHEYRELAKCLNTPPMNFLDVYYDHATMPKLGSMVSQQALHLYHARQRCDFNGVYIPDLSDEDCRTLYCLNLHPKETNEKLLVFVHQILKPPKGKSGRESKSSIWKSGTLSSSSDSAVQSLQARFPNSACFRP